ncbi:MAG: AmmeMemoRadiSam system protein B [Candidatus Magasanikbacteria bacterium]|jgi:gamma-polyglutamate biosynthesis protein CapA|nr:AmmeMemoRadiSam system protein B [Candidatus Magasanikbacteria bacterium]
MKRVACLFAIVLLFSGCQFTNTPLPNGESVFRLQIGNQHEAKGFYTQTFAPDYIYDFSLREGKNIAPTSSIVVRGGIIPHHLASGHTASAFLETLALQKPDTIIVIGPNHFQSGSNWVQITDYDWQTKYGTLQAEQQIIADLIDRDIARLERETFKTEHAVGGLMPLIAAHMPDVQVVPIVIGIGAPQEALDTLVKEIAELSALRHVAVVGSVDFSHYMSVPVADFHDELSKEVLRCGDVERINNMEIDSPETVEVVLRVMKEHGTAHVAHMHHTNSATLVKAPDEQNTTSHIVPYFTDGESECNRQFSMLHVGDMMLDRSVATRMSEHSPAWLFEELAGTEKRFFRGMDTVAANLEGPVVQHRIETSKEIAFRFDPALLLTLQEYNFDVLAQGNNHTLDMGHAGFAESQKHLAAAGFTYPGQQIGFSEDSYTIIEQDNATVAYFSVNDTNVPVPVEQIVEIMHTIEAQVDYMVVSIHWGQEYKLVSNSRQQELAHTFIDAGADAIIGHHPHVVQEIEVYKNRPIFYSLGNFIFDQYFSVPTQQGLGVGLIFETEQIGVHIFPIQSQQSQAQLMLPPKRHNWLGELYDRSKLDGLLPKNGVFFIQT